MNLPQAHGNKTRSIFWYCNNYRVAGNSWGFRAAERGKGVDFVRLLYIIRLWAFLLICRQARKWPLTTCYVYIALSCCFSGASFLLLVGGLKQWFWKNIIVKEGLIAKIVTEKSNEAWIVRKPAKRPCKPRGTRGGDFWRLGILPCGAARNLLSDTSDNLYIRATS